MVNSDRTAAVVDEHVVLEKFEGDPTQEEKDNGTADLLERLVFHNGVKIEHWRKEDESE
jgi:hypothetical protein